MLDNRNCLSLYHCAGQWLLLLLLQFPSQIDPTPANKSTADALAPHNGARKRSVSVKAVKEGIIISLSCNLEPKTHQPQPPLLCYKIR